MTILYSLNQDEIKIKKEIIGDIMNRINRILYEDTGLKLCILSMTQEEVLAGMNLGEYEVVLEEVLFKNLGVEEKKNKLAEYILKIKPKDKDLIIIDPYIFPMNYNDEYKKLIIHLLEVSQFKKLKVITHSSNFNRELYDEIKSRFENKITVVFSKDFHDRFWISNEKYGIVVGTSLNGIGSKICMINEIDSEDVKDIIKHVKHELCIEN